jgi:glutaredoxin 3|tara:strand:- start:2610 stop:2930 length:321 start_codon:yes stop_codon:yes gene_type:complete
MFFERPIFKMYVKTGCPYCEHARGIILKDLKSSLHLVDVTEQPDLQRMIKEETGHNTWPIIYLGKEFVGGCSDLEKIVESGDVKLKILVEENCVLREEVMRLRRSL